MDNENRKYYVEDYETATGNIAAYLTNYIATYGIKALVGGISGGIDSALTFALAYPVCKEAGIPLIGRSITIDSNKPEEVERARAIGKVFCMDFKEVNFTELYKVERELFFSSLFNYSDLMKEDDVKIAEGNLKARIRMKALYFLAGIFKGLVLSTDNLTELDLGFWTLHGDVGDLGLIQRIPKTDVYNMTEYLAHEYGGEMEDALMSTVNADATDGLGISKTDIDQLMPDWRERHADTRSAYREIDNILEEWRMYGHLEGTQQKYADHPIILRHASTTFKRLNPVNMPLEEILKGKIL